MLVADVGGFSPGPYRIVIHATPICTSPNGFSAGPPFVAAGSTGAPVIVMRPRICDQGSADVVDADPGLTLDRAPRASTGKSIVVHAGATGSLDAAPGVPNDRVACGVIGVVSRTLF